MQEIDVAIVGDIAWNNNITPTGQKESPGGGVYLASVGASHYSDKVGAVARIGNDFDISLLQRRGVDCQGIKIIPDGKTCRFVATQYADNTRDIAVDRGVAEIVETDIFPERYLSAQCIHLATQLPEHALIWLDFFVDHNNISVDSFEPFVADFPELTREMFRRAHMIFANEAEWSVMQQYGEEFKDKPVIIKRGKDGAVYKHGDQTITVPAPQVNAVEVSGAGDILAGAFLAKRAQGVSIEEALVHAVNVASLSVTEFGVEHILSKNNGA